MQELDPEAVGILIGNGLDVPTAVAGAIIDDEPPAPPPDSRGSGSARAVGALLGAGAMLACVIWRAL